MTKIETNKAVAFIVVFSIIALLINNLKHSSTGGHDVRFQQQGVAVDAGQQQLQMEREAAARIAAEAAAEHARFLARYLNTGFSRPQGGEALAIVVATQSGQLDHTFSSALADRFRTSNVKIFTSFFKPEFVTDKLFANAYEGSGDILNKLELAKSLDALLLARETVEYSKDQSLDNLISAHLSLEIQLVPITGSVQSHTWNFIANGAGFSKTEAESMAEERIIKQISNNTTLSLHN